MAMLSRSPLVEHEEGTAREVAAVAGARANPGGMEKASLALCQRPRPPEEPQGGE